MSESFTVSGLSVDPFPRRACLFIQLCDFIRQAFTAMAKNTMIPLETVHIETFAPLLGRTFLAETAALQLKEVKSLGYKAAGAAREPFSLLFHGPQGLRLPQGTYLFDAEGLGQMEFFISQIGDSPNASLFEAVFT
jgi:hypothetical protein